MTDAELTAAVQSLPEGCADAVDHLLDFSMVAQERGLTISDLRKCLALAVDAGWDMLWITCGMASQAVKLAKEDFDRARGIT